MKPRNEPRMGETADMTTSSNRRIQASAMAAVMVIWSTTSATSGLMPAEAAAQVPTLEAPGLVEPVPNRLESEPVILAFSASATSSIVRHLSGAVRECSALASEYAASCAAAAYKKAARSASRPDYRDARRHLNDAARKLDRLVAQNADPAKPPIRKGGNTYKAVKTSSVAKVNAAAVKIIAETETKLLRSSGSGQRKVHYQRIAQAVGSTKVIFRS